MHLICTVSASEWISLGVGVLGLVTAYLGRQDRLPSWARKWLKEIGSARVMDAIKRAAAIADLSPDERRKQAVAYLQRVCIKELGFAIPDSIANLLVEYIYQQLKRARK